MNARLYPSLGAVGMSDLNEEEEDDPLADLEIVAPKPKRPPRPPRPPPPTRAHSVPTALYSTPPTPQLETYALEDSPLAIPPPLCPHEVRWFYEEPGKFWQPFNGYDSLTLEDTYRKLQEKRGSANEYEVPVKGGLYEVNVLDRVCKPIYWTGKEAWRIMRGCWFEVCGEKWYPLDEKEHCLIEEEHVDEKWRGQAKADAELQQWAVKGAVGATRHLSLSSDEIKKQQQQPVVVLHRFCLEKYEVLWMEDQQIYKMKKEISAQVWKKVGKTFGKGQLYGATKLVRGYKDPALLEDRDPPIGHLVFVIHGIGQNMDGSNIVKSTGDFRDTCSQVAKKHFPDIWQAGRVEFIPVEWRTWLSLDKGTLDRITPHGVRMLRAMMNDSVLDVMYYMSQRFGPEILDGLRFTLNKQFAEFMQRHPTFLSNGGTISILAHSLGSVMTYDLLHETCAALGVKHNEPPNPSSGLPRSVELKESDDSVVFTAGLYSPESSLRSDQPPQAGFNKPDEVFDEASALLELEQLKKRVGELEKKLGGCAEQRKPKGLKFLLDHFFAVGSPLGVFIMMREHETLVKKGHKSACSIIPKSVCKKIHNLHHPSDPIAYRLEPLINPVYAQIRPVKVDSASSKPSKDAVDLAEGPKAEESPTPQKKSWFSGLWGTSAKKPSVEASKPKYPDKVMDNDKSLRPEDKLKERLDFMLRESLTESSYLNSITAHCAYWTSQDCAMYVLLQIYKYKTINEL